jgi:hypothetical protein
MNYKAAIMYADKYNVSARFTITKNGKRSVGYAMQEIENGEQGVTIVYPSGSLTTRTHYTPAMLRMAGLRKSINSL